MWVAESLEWLIPEREKCVFREENVVAMTLVLILGLGIRVQRVNSLAWVYLGRRRPRYIIQLISGHLSLEEAY